MVCDPRSLPFRRALAQQAEPFRSRDKKKKIRDPTAGASDFFFL